MKKDLESLYAEWRKVGEEAEKDSGVNFTWDCGESSARKDFSNFSELDEEISFDKMLELENNYQD